MSWTPPPSPTTVTQLSPFCLPDKLDAEAGDLIEIDRTLYSHWAVYVGDGDVVHVTGFGSDISVHGDDVVVLKAPLLELAGKSLVRVNNKEVHAKTQGLTALPSDVILANATRQLGQKVYYNILTQNCEHYVTEWRYGVKWSDQAATSLTVMSMFNQNGHRTRRPDSAAHYALMTSLAAVFQHTLPVSQSKFRKGHGHV